MSAGCDCGYHDPDIGPGTAAQIKQLSPRRHALHILRCNDRARSMAEDTVTAQVVTARKAGASWREIGEQLGITKQAAQKRYDRKPF